jgi:S1-C subfamily serine protease
MARRLALLTVSATIALVAMLLMMSIAVQPAAGRDNFTFASAPALAEGAVPGLAALQDEFNRITDAVVPSVVSITTRRTFRPGDLPSGMERLFRQRLPERLERSALGSGVIITREGHLVTNHHVVSGVDAIEVRLHDGRVSHAEVMATDQAADIAILKIEESKLTPLLLGDSDAVRVGDLVLAVGNPFGLRETVTNGIVSATERRVTRDARIDFLQTNAEINPGNSGGPLVNIRGEIIGINTAIAAGQGGGWQGVGFAIPSNVVRHGLDSIRRHGRIVRPHLGVSMQEVSAEVARERGLTVDEGLLVSGVAPGGPADRAGIRPGDVIVAFGGEPVRESGDLGSLIRHVEVGDEVPVEIVRNGTRRTFTAVMAEAPADEQKGEVPGR